MLDIAADVDTGKCMPTDLNKPKEGFPGVAFFSKGMCLFLFNAKEKKQKHTLSSDLLFDFRLKATFFF